MSDFVGRGCISKNNQTHNDEHFITYKNIKLLCCTLETNIIFSIKCKMEIKEQPENER